MRSSSPLPNHAFTLVELSIVLVILGLLVGGVLSGQSLIRAAELRSISSEYSRYITSVQTFRDKYSALPGDMNNANKFWGLVNTTAATCITTASTDKRTCDGDGNGRVDASTGSNEPFRFWQHLANAGLVEGSYTGAQGSQGVTHATKDNSPTGKLGGTLWMPFYFGTLSNSADIFFDGEYDNTLLFGGISTNESPNIKILKPEEMWNLDKKMDDGKPGIGTMVVRAKGTGLAACSTATGTAAEQATQINVDYLLTSTAAACTVAFRQIF